MKEGNLLLKSTVEQNYTNLSFYFHNVLRRNEAARELQVCAIIVLMMGAKSVLTAMLSWSFEEGQGCCLFMFPYHFTLLHSSYCPIACYPQSFHSVC